MKGEHLQRSGGGHLRSGDLEQKTDALPRPDPTEQQGHVFHLNEGQEMAAEGGLEPLIVFRPPAEMDEGKSPKIGGVERALRVREIGRRRQAEGFLVEANHFQPRVVRRDVKDAQVCQSVVQFFRDFVGMAGDEPQGVLRMFPAELVDRGKQDVIPQGMGTADKELLFRNPFHHQGFFSFPLQLEDSLGVGEEISPCRGEFDVPAGPFKQRLSDAFLQHLNADGDGGLDEVKGLRGPGEALGFGHLQEGFQLINFHGNPLDLLKKPIETIDMIRFKNRSSCRKLKMCRIQSKGKEAKTMDWKGWQRRWDRQQERYLPYREQSLEALVRCVEAVVCGQGRVLDLACGCGSVTACLLNRVPKLQVVGVDIDPVLLRIARGAFAGDARVRWIDRDLRDPRWAADLEPASFDAVVTATALHWLEESVLSRVYCDVAGLLRPGGVLVNADHMPLRSEVLSGAGSRLYAERFEAAADREDWDGWWEAISRKAGLADALEERERRFGRRRTHEFMPRSRGMYSISPVQAPLRRSFEVL